MLLRRPAATFWMRRSEPTAPTLTTPAGVPPAKFRVMAPGPLPRVSEEYALRPLVLLPAVT